MERVKQNQLRPIAFLPKAFGLRCLAGLLTRSALTPSRLREQTVAKNVKVWIELTAAGTVLDFHQIPF